MLPLKHVRTKTVIGEAFSWAKEGVLGELEVDEECFGDLLVLRVRYLIWMM